MYVSIHGNCPVDPPVTERAAAARAAAARETMRSNSLAAWSFIGAMKMLELDKNWPYTVCVLTTYCDMANVMLGEVYLLKENELLTHVTF